VERSAIAASTGVAELFRFDLQHSNSVILVQLFFVFDYRYKLFATTLRTFLATRFVDFHNWNNIFAVL
jgi:hypothetical protein